MPPKLTPAERAAKKTEAQQRMRQKKQDFEASAASQAAEGLSEGTASKPAPAHKAGRKRKQAENAAEPPVSNKKQKQAALPKPAEKALPRQPKKVKTPQKPKTPKTAGKGRKTSAASNQHSQIHEDVAEISREQEAELEAFLEQEDEMPQAKIDEIEAMFEMDEVAEPVPTKAKPQPKPKEKAPSRKRKRNDADDKLEIIGNASSSQNGIAATPAKRKIEQQRLPPKGVDPQAAKRRKTSIPPTVATEPPTKPPTKPHQATVEDEVPTKNQHSDTLPGKPDAAEDAPIVVGKSFIDWGDSDDEDYEPEEESEEDLERGSNEDSDAEPPYEPEKENREATAKPVTKMTIAEWAQGDWEPVKDFRRPPAERRRSWLDKKLDGIVKQNTRHRGRATALVDVVQEEQSLGSEIKPEIGEARANIATGRKSKTFVYDKDRPYDGFLNPTSFDVDALAGRQGKALKILAEVAFQVVTSDENEDDPSVVVELQPIGDGRVVPYLWIKARRLAAANADPSDSILEDAQRLLDVSTGVSDDCTNFRLVEDEWDTRALAGDHGQRTRALAKFALKTDLGRMTKAGDTSVLAVRNIVKYLRTKIDYLEEIE